MDTQDPTREGTGHAAQQREKFRAYAGIERRARVRKRSHNRAGGAGGRIEILPCVGRSDWHFHWAEVIDCSSHGLGLLIDAPLSAGENFLVQVREPRKLLLMYCVRYCQPAEGSSDDQQRHPALQRWRVGAEFTGMTADHFAGDPSKLVEATLLHSAHRISASPWDWARGQGAHERRRVRRSNPRRRGTSAREFLAGACLRLSLLGCGLLEYGLVPFI